MHAFQTRYILTETSLQLHPQRGSDGKRARAVLVIILHESEDLKVFAEEISSKGKG